MGKVMSVYKKIDSLRERYYLSARNKDSLLKLISEAEVAEQVYNSNAIENSTLSLEETEKILLRLDLDRYVTEREIFETRNLALVVEYIDTILSTGIDGATNASFTTTVAPEDLATYYGRVNNIAEQFVEDADYIKFREMSIGFNFPNEVLDRTFLTSANISLIGRNLFYIQRSADNIDPESAYNVGNSQGLEYFGVPSTKNYGLSINVKF